MVFNGWIVNWRFGGGDECALQWQGNAILPTKMRKATRGFHVVLQVGSERGSRQRLCYECFCAEVDGKTAKDVFESKNIQDSTEEQGRIGRHISAVAQRHEC